MALEADPVVSLVTAGSGSTCSVKVSLRLPEPTACFSGLWVGPGGVGVAVVVKTSVVLFPESSAVA